MRDVPSLDRPWVNLLCSKKDLGSLVGTMKFTEERTYEVLTMASMEQAGFKSLNCTQTLNKARITNVGFASTEIG